MQAYADNLGISLQLLCEQIVGKLLVPARTAMPTFLHSIPAQPFPLPDAK